VHQRQRQTRGRGHGPNNCDPAHLATKHNALTQSKRVWFDVRIQGINIRRTTCQFR
jgi:hypothetical protein